MAKRVRKFLPEACPKLIDEWDYAKNGSLCPESVSHGSHEKVWWSCSSAGHSWEAVVSSRVRGRGCPYCSGRLPTKENNLLVKFPRVCKEWDYHKNTLLPENYTSSSGQRVWWLCKEGHSWESYINNRIRGFGCPYCSGKKTTKGNNLAVLFPNVLTEWDYDRNVISPVEILPGSVKKVWWRCSKCDYFWRNSPNGRIKPGGRVLGCPACAGQVVSRSNNLLKLCPNLAREWSSKNHTKPNQVVLGSHKKVWWECSKKGCKYVWKSPVGERFSGKGCPACANLVVTSKNNLEIKFPFLAEEWDLGKNGFSPNEVVPGAAKKIWWKCSKGHSWCALLYNRTGKGYGCPFCSKGPVSRVSQKWLDKLGISQEYREHYIKKLSIRVDAYNPKTNTVYEFLGDYWHGNPEVFPPGKINPSNRKTFGELYTEAMQRLKLLEDKGYRVVHIWESDFKKTDNKK